MFFRELETLVSEHQDLRRVARQVDQHLSRMLTPTPLRPNDFACALGADENQILSLFEFLKQHDVLVAENMVECEQCQMLVASNSLQQAVNDEDPFECTGCGCIFSRRSQAVLVYRMTAQSMGRTNAHRIPHTVQPKGSLDNPSSDVPLSQRAQLVLVAMLELIAFDSDRRQSTDNIAVKALGLESDSNALKSVMAELKTQRLIDSKTGRGGGCWLTDTGRSRARKLRNSNPNSATV